MDIKYGIDISHEGFDERDMAWIDRQQEENARKHLPISNYFMNVPPNFTFFGKTKPLPVGDYQGKIISFDFKERTSKAGNPYVTLSARVEVSGQTYLVNLSLDPAEKGKATHSLILQMVELTGKTETELIEMCSVPQDFFNLAIGKTIKLISTPKGYLDVWSREELQNVSPVDVGF